MELIIENIGLIEKAEIKIGGLTLIAGKNDTGKSTIGKVLYSLIHTFSAEGELIFQKDVEEFLREDITDLRGIVTKELPQTTASEFVENIFLEIRIGKRNLVEISKDIIDFFTYGYQYSNEKITKKIEILSTILKTDPKLSSSYQRVLTKILYSEFEGQILPLKTTKTTGNIKLTANNSPIIECSIHQNHLQELKTYSELFHNSCFYVDSPFILEFLENNRYNYLGLSHLSFLLKSLSTDYTEVNIFDDLYMTNDQVGQILDKIFSITNGSLKYKSKEKKLVFEKNGLEYNFHNIATGIKEIGILQMLLKNKNLKNGALLILDEPEVHLHPEWQILFAEILVLLIKWLNLDILINSHSPYFIEAVKVFSDYYKLEQQNYYLTNCLSNGMSEIIDISNDLGKVFFELQKPFDFLDKFGN